MWHTADKYSSTSFPCPKHTAKRTQSNNSRLHDKNADISVKK